MPIFRCKPVAETEWLGQHEIVMERLLHQILFEFAFTLYIVNDGLETLFAQRTFCFDLKKGGVERDGITNLV